MGFSVNRRNSLRSPACAGKSLPEYRHVFRAGDHPRVCGEKFKAALHETEPEGSPPRVRGKDTLWRTAQGAGGITPACAGKSFCIRVESALEWDHPRVCGEKIYGKAASSGTEGSPPRVRGKAFFAVPDGDDTGITPACAGKRRSPLIKSQRNWDHPRVCGEKMVMLFLHRSCYRITPACAGKRPSFNLFMVSW